MNSAQWGLSFFWPTSVTINATLKDKNSSNTYQVSQTFGRAGIQAAWDLCPGSEDRYNKGFDFVITAEDVTNTITNSVTFATDGNGTIGGAYADIEHTGILDGSDCPTPPIVAADSGYHFLGWTKNGGSTYYTTSAVDGMTINDDVTFTAVFEEDKEFRVKNSNGPGGDHGYIEVTYNGTTVNLDAGESHTFDYDNTAGDVEIDFVADTGWSFKYYVIGNGATHINDDPDYIDPSSYAGESGANNMIQVNPKWDMDTYTVTWENWDGAQLEQDTDVAYMDTPSYDGSTPIRPATAEFTYTFSGWSPTISPVTGDITYTAQYTKTTNEYTVTWMKDTTQLEQDLNVAYGTQPDYNGLLAGSYSTPEFTFTFVGWNTDPNATTGVADTALPTVTGNVTYYAIYSKVTNKYTVTWNDEDGTQLEQDLNVPYGDTPSYDSATPTKPATAEFTYTFSGWTPAVSSVTGNVTYTATYSETRNAYTVRWKSEGVLLEKDLNVPYGDMPSYDGDTPEKPADAQYTYTFSHWSPTISPVTGNIVYKAQFSETLNTYTVKWKSLGVLLEKDEEVPYGDMPSYDGATPVKPADAQYTYTFSGWNPTVSLVTGDIVYRATFSKTLNTYTVKWKSLGVLLEKDEEVPYGDMPSYDGATPVKPADAQYTYTFSHWNPTVSLVTGDIVYRARFSKTTNEYTITWEDEDGTQLEQDLNVPYGDTPSYDSATPTKAATAQYTYTFAGWTPTVSTVTGDATYTATYTETLNDYTVTWNDEDGTQLEQDVDVPYGTTPSFDSATPTKAATAQYTYTFAGWTPVVDTVTGDATYTATYTETLNDYTVTWNNYNGVQLEQDLNVPYGDTPTYDGATPAQPATAQYTYTFAGWTPTVSAVTGDVIYTAQFTQTTNSYPITFVNFNGVTLKVESVLYGNGATAPGVPARTGYTFTGWNVPYNNITGPLTVTAQFVINSYPYTVNYVDANGDPIADPTTDTAVYNSTVTVTPVEVEGYTPRLESQDITIATTGNEATFIYDEDEVGGTTGNDRRTGNTTRRTFMGTAKLDFGNCNGGYVHRIVGNVLL